MLNTKNADLRAELKILKREKEHAIFELQSFIDSAVKVSIASKRLGVSIEFKIKKDNMRKDEQNIKSNHYKETRAMRKENVKLVGTIEKCDVKLVGTIEYNIKSEMSMHLKSNYENEQL